MTLPSFLYKSIVVNFEHTKSKHMRNDESIDMQESKRLVTNALEYHLLRR